MFTSSFKLRDRSAVPFGLALGLVLLVGGAAHAQVVKHFKISGAGYGPEGLPLPGQPARPHWAIGEATHLGRYFGEGTVKTDSATFVPEHGGFVGEFGSGSPFVFQGANGDKLACNYGRSDIDAAAPGTFFLEILDVLPGDFLVVKAYWIAEFVAIPDQSTGKFAGVRGSWIMFARSEPFVLGSSDPVAYSWDGQGTLTFKKGK